jgi:hypothetical protein
VDEGRLLSLGLTLGDLAHFLESQPFLFAVFTQDDVRRAANALGPVTRRQSPKNLSSWVGACPGDEESAGMNKSTRCPGGNRHMRRILNQAANAAVKQKGSIFEVVYRRLVPRLGHGQTIGAITHRLCRLIWIILHQGVSYEERGPAVSQKSRRRRTTRMIRELRSFGYEVQPLSVQTGNA